jgi:hypothetical protein
MAVDTPIQIPDHLPPDIALPKKRSWLEVAEWLEDPDTADYWNTDSYYGERDGHDTYCALGYAKHIGLDLHKIRAVIRGVIASANDISGRRGASETIRAYIRRGDLP